ncbi:MAG TPA: SDR family oxidoreductase [Caulobacteraceae bacterium]|jgi:nucleoside-diphosphate-sugar epimerase
MRVFLTGANGFIGTAVAEELRAAGHEILGQARNDAAAATLESRGIAVHRGDLNDPASFAAGARLCDGVIHTAFIHDFTKFAENMAIEQKAVVAMVEALQGSGKPLVVTSGTGLLAAGRMAVETDTMQREGRGETEAIVLAASGIRSSSVRLPPITHEGADGGFGPLLIQGARDKGVSNYVGEGANHWPAGHRRDAARIFRLALEKGEAGGVYHAIGDEGVPTRDIAAAIGRRLGVPTASITAEQAMEQFGFVGMFFSLDIPASSAITQAKLGWRPEGAGLLQDLEFGAERNAA